MVNKKALEMSFAWIFAIIAGAAIIFLAIYISTTLVNSGEYEVNTKTTQAIVNLLDPLQTSSEQGKTPEPLNLIKETRIYTICSSSGKFGENRIQIQEKSGFENNQYTEKSGDIGTINQYVFADDMIEGKKIYFFIIPYKMPFKIADIMILYTKPYCFVNPPRDIEDFISPLSSNSLNITNSMAVDTSLFYVNSVNKRVGIHTSSPSAAFEVVQDGSASTVYVTGYRLTAGNGAFYYARSARGTEAAPTALALGDAAGTYAAAAYNGSDFQILGRVLFHIDSNTSGLYGSTIQFNNRNGAGAEVTPMVINENGSVGIGTTSPAQALTVVGQINVTSLAAASATDLCINGGVLSSCSSSKAFKENIQNITINADLWENYLKLNPVIYNFKGDSKERIGLIAEDVQPLLPKVVYDIKVPVYGEVNETSIIMDGEGNYIEVNSTRQAIIDEKTYPSVDYDDVAAANILFIQDLERRLEIVETESCTKDPTFSWC